MNIIQNPYYVYAPDDADYVETRNEDGELVNYHLPVEGFFVIHHKPVPELSGMEFDTSAVNLVSTGNSGAPTYTYRLESRADYEAIFPPVVEDMPEPAPTEPAPYDLEAGKAQAKLIANDWYNKKAKILQNGYPDMMLVGFPTKKEEALRVVAGGQSSFLDGLDKDGRTTLQYANRILELSELFQNGSIEIENAWNAANKSIDSAQTQQDISDIIGGMING